ncbi:hypothetical protein K438DRAFT_1974859 [Mycena galopus ATCC 62051]|nr:hypothetical protein K438DRAFT_1974859 [Mycena galopus ATCC 62051]
MSLPVRALAPHLFASPRRGRKNSLSTHVAPAPATPAPAPTLLALVLTLVVALASALTPAPIAKAVSVVVPTPILTALAALIPPVSNYAHTCAPTPTTSAPTLLALVLTFVAAVASTITPAPIVRAVSTLVLTSPVSDGPHPDLVRWQVLDRRTAKAIAEARDLIGKIRRAEALTTLTSLSGIARAPPATHAPGLADLLENQVADLIRQTEEMRRKAQSMAGQSP